MTWSPKWTTTVSAAPPLCWGPSLLCLEIWLHDTRLFSPFLPPFSSSSLSVARKIDELQLILKKKDEDMKQMEDRYKRYVEKARTVSQPAWPSG